MAHEFADIARALKSAREAGRLSQRELGARAGVPQSHVSKIESGVVDLRLSSLVALTRALGLEVTLVPRRSLAAVRAVAGLGAGADEAPRPAYSLDDEDG